MRCILYVGIFFVFVSILDLATAESKKYNKYDIAEGSGETFPKKLKENRKKFQISDKLEEKGRCKGKQCITDSTDIKTKYKSDKFESSGDKITKTNQKNPYKARNMNYENDEKYVKKVKTRSDTVHDSSKENFENQRKIKKKDKSYNNLDEYRKKKMVSKTEHDNLDSDEKELKYSRLNRKQNDNNKNDLTQKKVIKEKIINKNRNEDDEKPKKKTMKNIIPNSAAPTEDDNLDDETTDRSVVNSDDSEFSDVSNGNDEKNENENNPDNDSDDDNSNDNDASDDEGESTDLQSSCNKSPNCNDDDGSNEDESNELVLPKKKVKYSIKFAHEKQKYTPTVNDNILRKIHGLEKKKNMHHDSDEDSSEEDIHPKRLHFIEDEEDY